MPAALITGGSSNLGISAAIRLIDTTVTVPKALPPPEVTTIIITSRTLPKALDTIAQIKSHADKNGKTMAVEFDYLLVDFSNMVSVLAAYHEIVAKYRHLDLIVLNSVQTCYDGIDWFIAARDVLSNPIRAVTEGTMKIQRKGVRSADGMGLLFQGNVFGPYYLLHLLRPILGTNGASKGANTTTIVWVSSIISGPEYFLFNDFQLINNPTPYEGSKRLVDLIHLGSYNQLSASGIRLFVVNPGIFTSFGFYQYLNVFTYYGMLMLFYVARWLGSDIHNISGYAAANAIIRCVVADEPQDKKIVSCTGRGGEYVKYSEIEGTGAEDVVLQLDEMCAEWDKKFAGRIVDTRRP